MSSRDVHKPDGGAPPNRSTSSVLALADLALDASNFREAADRYRDALASGGDLDRATVFRKLSECLLRLGETIDAQTAIQEAAFAVSSGTDVVEHARIEMQFGRVRLKNGPVDDAMVHAERAVALLEDRPPCREYGSAVLFQGSLAYRKSRSDEAMRHYQTALKVFKDLGALGQVARVYRNIGILHKDACNWTRSLECYQVAHNLLSMEGEYDGLAAVTQSLGVVHLRMGNLGEAVEHFEKSLKVAREVGDTLGSSQAQIGLADVALLRRQYATARELAWEALETCLLRHYLFGSYLSYKLLAEVALAAGETDEARRNCDKASEVARRMGGSAWVVAGARVLEARVAVAEGNLDGARAAVNSALPELENRPDRITEATGIRVMGEVEALAGSPDAANARFEEAADILSRVGERFYLAEIRERHGRFLLSSPDDRARLAGVGHLLEATEIYRGIGVPMGEAAVLLAIAREDIRQRAVDRATERLERARELAGGVSDEHAWLEKEIGEVNDLLEHSFVTNAISTKESLETHHRMERVLRSEHTFDQKIADFLRVLGETIPSDGACLLTVGDTEMRVIGSHGIPSVVSGRSYKLPTAFRASGWPANQTPMVFFGMRSDARREGLAPMAAGRPVAASVVIPLGKARSGWSVLYVDRLVECGNPHFHQAEVSYAMTLSRQLGGFLEEANIRNRRGLRELHRADQNIALADIVTENTEMQGLLGLVARVAPSNLSVLLQGETGTGKKLIARALHQCSGRSEAPFITVDCAALPESILESELFGYVKGAFTGADKDRPGILEQADGGTVFLDEIDKTSLTVQRRFLHLLDTGEIRAVGGRSYRLLDLRVVCATSAADLRQEVEEGRFIKDLYFRLNDISIQVPALRRRRDDVPLLAEFFMDIFSQDMGKNIDGISQMAMKKLLDYDWPGNVRELEKVMRRAITLADDGETVGIDLLPPRLLEDDGNPGMGPVTLEAGTALKDQLEEIEKQLVLRSLEEHGWNKSRTAVTLGLSRKGLKNKIVRYGLDRRSGSRR